MAFDYIKGILTFVVGFILSFIVVSIFEDTDLGIITAICYLGAIISGWKK